MEQSLAMASPGVLGVFWDIENCRVPSTKSASSVVARIRALDVCKSNREMIFLVVCDVTKESEQVVDELNTAQVSVQHVFSGRNKRNAADAKIRVAMRSFVDTHTSVESKQNVVVVLISSDADFMADLSDLKHRQNVYVVLVHNANASQGLIEAAHEAHEFRQIVLEVPLTYTELEVRNLPSRLEHSGTFVQDRLTALFAPFSGAIRYINDMDGCAVIKFEKGDRATAALRALQSTPIGRRKMHLDYNRRSSLYDKEKARASSSSPRHPINGSQRNANNVSPKNVLNSSPRNTQNSSARNPLSQRGNVASMISASVIKNDDCDANKPSKLVITRHIGSDPGSPIVREVREQVLKFSAAECQSQDSDPAEGLKKKLSPLSRTFGRGRCRPLKGDFYDVASKNSSDNDYADDIALLASMVEKSILLSIVGSLKRFPGEEDKLERHLSAILHDFNIACDEHFQLKMMPDKTFKCYLRVANLEEAENAVRKLASIRFVQVKYVYERQRRAAEVLKNLKSETGSSWSDIVASLEDFNYEDDRDSISSSSSSLSSTFQMKRILPNEGIVEIQNTTIPIGHGSSSPIGCNSKKLVSNMILPDVEISLKDLRQLLDEALSCFRSSIPYHRLMQALVQQQEKSGVIMRVGKTENSVPIELLIDSLDEFRLTPDLSGDLILKREPFKKHTSHEQTSNKAAFLDDGLESRIISLLKDSSGLRMKENNDLPEAFFSKYKQRLNEFDKLPCSDKVVRIGTGSSSELILSAEFRVSLATPTIRRMLVEKPMETRFLDMKEPSFFSELENSTRLSLADFGVCTIEDFGNILANVSSNIFTIAADGLLKPSKDFCLFTRNTFAILRDAISMPAHEFDSCYVLTYGNYSVPSLSYGFIGELFRECYEFQTFNNGKVLHLALSDDAIFDRILDDLDQLLTDKEFVALEKLQQRYYERFGTSLENIIRNLTDVRDVASLVERLCSRGEKSKQLSFFKTDGQEQSTMLLYKTGSAVASMQLRLVWLLFLIPHGQFSVNCDELYSLFKAVFGPQCLLLSETLLACLKKEGLIVDSTNLKLTWACHQACITLKQLREANEMPDGGSLRLLRMKLPQSLEKEGDKLSEEAKALPMNIDYEVLRASLTSLQPDWEEEHRAVSASPLEESYSTLNLTTGSEDSNNLEKQQRRRRNSKRRSRMAAVFNET